MKNIIVAISIFILLLGSCTNNFESINENPNAPSNIKPQFLLSNVISVTADKNTYDQGFRLANFLAQFAASVEFERIDRYEMGSNNAYWNELYALLADIQSMKSAEGTNEAYRAVGDVLEAYIFSQLTDMWGDIPYTEALGAVEGEYTPVYDTQEDIYTHPETGILAVLRNAVETLSSTESSIEGDMMFDNDLDKWVRFANSLRVRYFLRISKRLNDFSELQEIVNSGQLMRSNEDNAVVPYLSSAPFMFPLSQASLGIYNEHRMTKTVDSILTQWQDPRMEVLYKPTEKSLQEGDPKYKGLLNGQSRETISSKGIDLEDISLFGAIFRDVPDGIDAQYMQYAELQFALAEAVEKGFISGNAQVYYKNGIKASFDYYDVPIPPDYFDRPDIALNGTDHLKKILTQKWLSLINNGHEAWFNVRRTGIPKLKPGPDNLNNDKYPVRYLYPQSEQATNLENYESAIDRIGGDNINSEGWWEAD